MLGEKVPQDDKKAQGSDEDPTSALGDELRGDGQVSAPTGSQEKAASGVTTTQCTPDVSSEEQARKGNPGKTKKHDLFTYLSRQKDFITTVIFFLGAVGFMYSTFATQNNLKLMECLLKRQTEMNKEYIFQRERLHSAQMIQNEVFILAKAEATLTPHEAEVYALLENIAKQEAIEASEAGERMKNISDEILACHE